MNPDRTSKDSFNRLWAGETLNLYVEQFIAFAAPLLIVTQLGGTVSQGQVLTFLFFVPYLLFGLNAGVWLEERSKQRVVMVSVLAQALVLLLVVAASSLSWLGVYALGLFVLLSGVIAVFFQIAYQSYLPTIYSDQASLLVGNARLALSDAVTRVAGPATAGGLLAYAGVTGSFALQFGLMVVATVLFSLMRSDPGSARSTRDTSTVTLIRQGVTFVRRHGWLKPIIACGAYYTVFVTAIKTTVILYLVASGRASESAAGLVAACIALGYGTGSVASRRAVARVGTRRALQLSALVAVSGIAASAWAAGSIAAPGWAVLLTGLAFLVHGLGDGVFAPTALSVRQVVTPSHLMSRVTSVHRFFIWGGMSVGALTAALVTALAGAGAALIVFGVLAFGTLPVLYRANFRLHGQEGDDVERDPQVALLHAE